MLLALIWGLSITKLAILVIFVAAVIAIVAVALKRFGVPIPDWAAQVFWILVVAFVCGAAILLLASMLGVA